jgi:uncharacterized protein
MLTLNIKELKATPEKLIAIEGQTELKSVPFRGRELPARSPISLKTNVLYRKDGRVELTELEAQVTLVEECSRCLKELSLPILAKYELLQFEPGEPDQTFLEEEAFTYPAGAETLDLLPYVIGLLVSELDIKPLCRRDCKGLCHHCGADLNQGPCACPKEETADPRLSVLKTLLKKG